MPPIRFHTSQSTEVRGSEEAVLSLYTWMLRFDSGPHACSISQAISLTLSIRIIPFHESSG